MREVAAEAITRVVARLCIEANTRIPPDVLAALRAAREEEPSPVGRQILAELVENAELAAAWRVPVCQDTGMATVFVTLGQEVCITGGSLNEAIQAGISLGYREGRLRASVVDHPLRRRNTGDNTPAVVHVEMVEGATLHLLVLPKGAGSENMTRLAMLSPADGWEGVKRAVVEAVTAAGPNPCPPLIIGVGIGGTAEMALLLAKKALARPILPGEMSPEEQELLQAVNATGIGPQGLGGRVTALAVHVAYYPTHMASLPVGIALGCHALRRAEADL